MSIKKKLRIGLIGAQGKLGRSIASLTDPSCVITESFSRNNLPRPDCAVDVWIDVSSAEALEENLRVAREAKKPIVIGTTGHRTLEALQRDSLQIPIFYSANFSIGMSLMDMAVREIARRFPEEGVIALTETHHIHKKDAPSGSALALRRSLEQVSKLPVQVFSRREGETVGVHEVIFETEEEKIVLTHMAKNRSAFAKGALRAALFIAEQPPGFYTMSDLLGCAVSNNLIKRK